MGYARQDLRVQIFEDGLERLRGRRRVTGEGSEDLTRFDLRKYGKIGSAFQVLGDPVQRNATIAQELLGGHPRFVVVFAHRSLVVDGLRLDAARA